MPALAVACHREVALTDEQRALVVQYRLMAFKFAGRKYHTLPIRVRNWMSRDDMNGAAMLGLIRAAKTWDPSIAAMSTHLFWSCVGSMSKYIKDTLREVGGRPDKCNALQSQPWYLMEPDDLANVVEAKRERVFHGADLIRTLIDGLPERERRAIRMRYFDGLTLREVGERMGITKERVRQIAAKGMETMRIRGGEELRMA